MDWYYVVINGHTNGYHNRLENIKNALYELFGDVPVAHDGVMKSAVSASGLVVEIVKVEEN